MEYFADGIGYGLLAGGAVIAFAVALLVAASAASLIAWLLGIIFGKDEDFEDNDTHTD